MISNSAKDSRLWVLLLAARLIFHHDSLLFAQEQVRQKGEVASFFESEFESVEIYDVRRDKSCKKSTVGVEDIFQDCFFPKYFEWAFPKMPQTQNERIKHLSFAMEFSYRFVCYAGAPVDATIFVGREDEGIRVTSSTKIRTIPHPALIDQYESHRMVVKIDIPPPLKITNGCSFHLQKLKKYPDIASLRFYVRSLKRERKSLNALRKKYLEWKEDTQGMSDIAIEALDLLDEKINDLKSFYEDIAVDSKDAPDMMVLVEKRKALKGVLSRISDQPDSRNAGEVLNTLLSESQIILDEEEKTLRRFVWELFPQYAFDQKLQRRLIEVWE